MNPYVSPVNHGQFKNPICAKIYDVMYKFLGNFTHPLDVEFEEVNSSYNEVRCYVGQKTTKKCKYFHMLLDVESRNYYTQSVVLTVTFSPRGFNDRLPSVPLLEKPGIGIIFSERCYDFNVMMAVTERVPECGYFSMEQFMGEDIESVGCKNDNILNHTREDVMYEYDNVCQTLESCYVPNSIKCENVLYEPLRVWAVKQLSRCKYGRKGTITTF